MIKLLTAYKNFNDPVLGNVALNRLGLHANRMRIANWLNRFRCAQVRGGSDPAVKSLSENGYAVVKNFLPQDLFERLADEAGRALEKAEAATPIGFNDKPGFGQKQDFNWGFQRYDGGTLNRFVNIDDAAMPAIAEFKRNARLSHLVRKGVGITMSPNHYWIYTTVHGDETANPDIQKALHRDTFFSSIKFWFYFKPVTLEEGPFVYVPGSHKLTRPRLKWEQDKALVASQSRFAPKRQTNGSFRIEEKELTQLDLPEPKAMPVVGNTLVIADTLGFHRRGDGVPGSRRVSIYGNKRPWPFWPVPR